MKVLIVFLAILGSFFVFGQSTLPVFGIIKDLDSGKKLAGVQVTIFSGSSKVKNTTTASNGKYEMSVPINAVYRVKYTKPGYVTKIVEIDVTGINEEDIPPGELPQPAVDLDLFTNRPSTDFSFTSADPVASFFYDNKAFRMDYNRAEATKMRNKIDELLATAEVKEQENEAKYNELVTKADLAFTQEKYDEAQIAYTEALKLKPTEAHPSNRLVEIDDLLAAQRKEELLESQANQVYQNLITAGENFLKAKEYDKAIAKFNQAALEKPTEQLPKDKVAEANALKKAEANKEKYDSLIKMADGFMKQNSLQAARDKYTAASKLDPSQSYPKEQLAKIEEGLKAKEELAQKKQKYDDAVLAGDKLLAEKKFAASKVKYEEALSFESAATYPRAKIKEIDIELEKLAAENAIEEQILALIKEADEKMTASEYTQAIEKYEEAGQLKEPTDYTKAQIKKAKDALAELENEAKQKEIAEKYKAQIEKADQLYTDMNYAESILAYTEAKAIQSSAPYPDVQIEKANLKISEAKEQAAQTEIDNKFNALKVAADELFASQKYDDAKIKYTEALAVKSSEEVNAQLSKIEVELNRIAELENKQAEIEKLFKTAKLFQEQKNYTSEVTTYESILTLDKSNVKAKELLEKAQINLKEANEEAQRMAQFTTFKDEGDALFTLENWTDAKLKYEQAIEIKEDKDLTEKINSIEQKLKEIAESQNKAEKVEGLIQMAVANMGNEKFEEAIENYQSVLELDAINSIAKTGLEAAKLARANKAEQLEKDAAFEKLKTAGIQLLAQEKLEESKASFLSAKEIKEDEKVLDYLAEIEEKLAGKQNEAERLQSYQNAISEAQMLEEKEEVLAAIEKYREALAYKPNDAVATNKIKDLELNIAEKESKEKQEAEFNTAMQAGKDAFEKNDFTTALLNYEKALQVKIGDSKAKQGVADAKEAIKANAKNAEDNQRFESLMSEAKENGDNNDLDAAMSLYKQALAIKPESERAKNALDAIYALNEIRKKEALNAEKQEALEQQYSAKLSEAEVALQNKNYQTALDLYKTAQELKPSAVLPKEKIAEISELINSINENETKNNLFTTKMQAANTAFDNKKYTESITLYQGALDIKDDAIARAQIDRAKAALAATESANETANYNGYIKSANTFFSQQNYTQALDAYQNALSVKPGDNFASNKIKEVEQILDNQDKLAKEKIRKQAEFKALVEEADFSFEAKTFIEAKKKYELALALYPNDVYANDQLTKSIEGSKRAAAESGNKQYQKIVDKADEYFENENWEKAQELYKRLLALKPYESYPQNQLDEIARRQNENLVELSDLENLGQPDDISVIEGAALLADAERKRANKKKQKITEQLTEKRKKTEGLNYTDDEERQKMSEQAIKAQKLKELESLEGDARRQSIVTAVDDKEEEMAQKSAQESVFERGEVLRLAQDIDVVDSEIAAERAREERTYREKAKQVDAVDIDMAQFHQKELQVEIDRTKKVYEDISVEINKMSTTEDLESEYAQIQKIQKSAQLAEIEMYESSKEKQAIRQSLENDVKLLGGEARRKATQDEAENNQASLLMDETMTTARQVIQEYYDESDENRKLTLDKIDRKDLEMNEASRQAALKEKKQIENNELTIEQTKAIIAQNKKDDTKEQQALQEEVVTASSVITKANKTKAEIEKLDRENTFQSLESTEKLRTSISSKQEDQTKENSERVKAATNAIGRGKAVEAELYKEKAIERQKIIDGFENNSRKYDETIANTLGEEFPEGVSQEVFVRNDEDGLPVKVVTRRIVVKDGRGEVYIRTQSKFGLTYTKNGNSITKQSWINGTENATLTKNY